MANWRIDVNENAWGGTELLMHRLYEGLGEEYLEPFQIIPSRVRELKQDKIRILWCHDLAGDPECNHLANDGWEKFHKIVFVSYLQREEYILRYNIPLSRTTVLHNSIFPIDVDIEKKQAIDRKMIDVVYHTTPHRGLNILIPVFKKLNEKYPNIHLHVYSSFKIYGWEKRDEPYQNLFDEIKNDPNMTYYGSVSNDEIREVLKRMHIFAYPSTWTETSSLCLMEAMSAGCMCVHSSLGALPETGSNWTMMYDYHEDLNSHANRFYGVMDHVIGMMEDRYPVTELKSQKSYVDLFYSWELRQHQWRELLENVKKEVEGKDLGVPKPSFTYKAT